MVRVIVSFQKKLTDTVKKNILTGFRRGQNNLLQTIKTNAPKDLGTHIAGYRMEPAEFKADNFSAALVNDIPNSLYRERGRGPGKRPPISAIAGWARRKKLNPYLVAKKIGEKGTDRWIDNDNPLGIDRTSTQGKIIVNKGSVIISVINSACELANDWEL